MVVVAPIPKTGKFFTSSEEAGDQKAAALQKSAEVLEQLDALTASGATPEKVVEPSTTQQLDALEPFLDKALEDRDEIQVRSIAGQAQELLAVWLRRLQEDVADAQSQHQDALAEFGSDSEVTRQAAAVLTEKEHAFHDDGAYIEEQQRHFNADDLVAAMHEGAPQAVPTTQEKSRTLEELLGALREATLAYKARLAELEAETKSVAEQIKAERIAALTAGVKGE